MRLTFELVGQEKQIALINEGGTHPISGRPEQEKNKKKG